MPPKGFPAQRVRPFNVEGPLILVHLPNDPGGLPWQRRLLVLQVGVTKWVSLNRDMEMEAIDLEDADYVLLDPRHDLPERWSALPEGVTAPQPVPQSELDRFRREARAHLDRAFASAQQSMACSSRDTGPCASPRAGVIECSVDSCDRPVVGLPCLRCEWPYCDRHSVPCRRCHARPWCFACLRFHRCGEPSADPSAVGELWVVADPRDLYFGTVVPAQAVKSSEGLTAGGARGLAEHEGEFRFVERVGRADLNDTIGRWRTADRDCRVLQVQRNAQGNRNRNLAATVPLLTEEAMPDWPLFGTRSFKEASDAVLHSSQSWRTYHLTWAQESGVTYGSSLCREHEVLCEAFTCAHEIDQVNASNLSSFELLIRRLIQIEIAVCRNNKVPDFTGLWAIPGAAVADSEAAPITGFSCWVCDRPGFRARLEGSRRSFGARPDTMTDSSTGASSGRSPTRPAAF